MNQVICKHCEEEISRKEYKTSQGSFCSKSCIVSEKKLLKRSYSEHLDDIYSVDSVVDTRSRGQQLRLIS